MTKGKINELDAQAMGWKRGGVLASLVVSKTHVMLGMWQAYVCNVRNNIDMGRAMREGYYCMFYCVRFLR